jgi:glycine dehydrogenase subunit 1
MIPYVFNTPADRQAMLAAIGASSVEELLAMVPEELRLKRDLNLPPALTEIELTQHLSRLAALNTPAGQVPCFLGGGSYDHFIPAAVDALAGRGEFYTSYTPYQPEVSQGNLQVMFEYQSLICRLTGMDVSNASLYDGGSAAVEAALLCMAAVNRHGKVVTTAGVHPEYRQIISTYFADLDAELVTVGDSASGGDGAASVAEVAAAVDERTACVLVQHPNFFGCLEDVERLAEVAHAAGALLVVSFDPISLGLLKRPGDLGADVAVAEGQSLGSPMAYGGPYLGIMACKEQFMRRMPGRIAGETTAYRGRRCFVLTLQTREQHIRREKATSNICTNQGLYALRASIYLALMGPAGLREAAQLCVQKAHYAARRLFENDRFAPRFFRPVFKEFVVQDKRGQVAEALAQAQSQGFLAGLPLGRWYPDLDDCFLVTVTEKRTRQEIDALADCLAAVEESSFNPEPTATAT